MIRVNLSTEKSPAADCVHPQLSGWAGLSKTASSHLPCVNAHQIRWPIGTKIRWVVERKKGSD